MKSTNKTAPTKKAAVKKPPTKKHGISNPVCFSLPVALTIQTVEALAEQFSAIEGDFIFDASATEILTTPGIQLLLSADASAQTSGKHLHILNARESLAYPMHLLGLEATWAAWTSDIKPELGSEA